MEKQKMSYSNRMIIDAYSKGYRIDNEGRVYKPDGTLQKLSRSSLNYYRFQHKGSSLLAHRFVMFCRVGDKMFTKGLMVLHKNDNGFDNSYDNLYLGNHKDNARDCIKNNRLVKKGTYNSLYPEIYNYYLIYGQKKTVEKYTITQNILRSVISKFKSKDRTRSPQISIPFE